MQPTKPNKILRSQKESLSSLLKKTGFLMPTTEQEVEENEKCHGNTEITLPKEVDSHDFIFKRLNTNEKKPNKIEANSNSFEELKKNTNDYFKKLVLAAEIVNELSDEPTFGHIKLVKIYFICEEVCEMKLSTNYGQFAAGPLDPKQLYTIDSQFKKRKWFTVSNRKGGYGFKYEPDINVLDYKIYYSRYFKNHVNAISRVIELFRKQPSSFCEIVATLLAVRKRLLIEDSYFTEELLIENFYSWSDEKRKFTKQQLTSALSWMKDNEIIQN